MLVFQLLRRYIESQDICIWKLFCCINIYVTVIMKHIWYFIIIVSHNYIFVMIRLTITWDTLYIFANIKVYGGHLTLVILLIHWPLPFRKSFDTSFHVILSINVLSDVLLKKRNLLKKLNFITIFTFYLLCFEIGARKKICY